MIENLKLLLLFNNGFFKLYKTIINLIKKTITFKVY